MCIKLKRVFCLFNLVNWTSNPFVTVFHVRERLIDIIVKNRDDYNLASAGIVFVTFLFTISDGSKDAVCKGLPSVDGYF